MIVEILITVLALGLIDYYFIRKESYREKRFFWPALAALNVTFVLLVLPNLILR